MTHRCAFLRQEASVGGDPEAVEGAHDGLEGGRGDALVETDAPYLTQSPYRGKPNASYLIPHTVRKMADVLNISVPELCAALNDNANRAFGGHW